MHLFCARSATFLILAAALAACGGYNSMFPRREDIFKPIPVSLGDVRVQDGDTAYVLGGPGYQVVSRERDLLPDAKTALDRLASQWRQYFSAEPTRVTVVVRSAPRRGEAAASDTARPRPGAAAPEVEVVAARRGGDRYAPQVDMPRVTDRMVATPLVRAWLSALAAGRGPAPAPDTAATAANRPGRSPVAWRDDPRIPDWVESALPTLVGSGPEPEFTAAQLQQSPERLLPLRTLLTSSRPDAPGDSSRDERRRERDAREGRGDRSAAARALQPLSGARFFDAQALSVAQFLADREGRAFVGRVVNAALGGRVEDALVDANALPHDLEGLDRSYRSWLETQAANGRERMRGRRSGGN